MDAPPLDPDRWPAGVGVLGVDHVGVAVPDLATGLLFYTDVLGLVVRHREDNPEMGVTEAMLGPPGAAGGSEVQVLAPLGASPLQRFLERSGPGLQHLAFRVTDLHAACSRLRQQGLRLIYHAGRRGTRGSAINFVHPGDTGGVLVELVEVAHPPA